MSAISQGKSRTTGRSRSWRVATAIRAFGLAFVFGLTGSHAALQSNAAALVAMAAVALASSLAELSAMVSRARWIPVLEGAVVAGLLGAGGYDASLAPYLIVPAAVAGARHGWLPAMNAGLLVILGLITGAAVVATHTIGPMLSTNMPWAVLGLGGGLLAGWQTRNLRELEGRQAPYAAAHQLVAQLHRLVDAQSLAFDPVHIAENLMLRVSATSNAEEVAVVVNAGGRPRTLLGSSPHLVDAVALSRSLENVATTHHEGRNTYLPLRLDERTFGAVIVGGVAVGSEDAAALQTIVDETVLHLETALLFSEVRERATTEERARLAREIHDGVAQEMVALGYLIDEIEAQSTSPSARTTASALRQEVNRLLADLRFSVFDLRHDTTEGNLSDALASCAREGRAGSDLAVHLSLGEVPALPHHVEAELLRIAREALSNARRHAHARNLWLSLDAHDASLHLRVEDDGIGGAVPTAGHYGMHTMRERAEGIGARLVVGPGAERGTAVTLEWSMSEATQEAQPHELHSPAGR